MFTGIIQATAPIVALEQEDTLLRYAISFPKKLLTHLELGASVSVDGICQTVIDIDQDKVYFEAISETLSKTTLDQLQLGTHVNLERSAKFGDEIGGHLLSGHIYGTAQIVHISNNIYTFKGSPLWMKYLFAKGFIAVDGMSLTLVEVDKNHSTFTVHLIPETLKRTTLGQKQEGALVNIEVDHLTVATVETVFSLNLK